MAGIKVEVVYAEPGRCVKFRMEAACNESVAEIILRSRIFEQCLDLLKSRHEVGIFGVQVSPDSVPEDGDRIEIYRPLKRHPMEARRLRSSA